MAIDARPQAIIIYHEETGDEYTLNIDVENPPADFNAVAAMFKNTFFPTSDAPGGTYTIRFATSVITAGPGNFYIQPSLQVDPPYVEIVDASNVRVIIENVPEGYVADVRYSTDQETWTEVLGVDPSGYPLGMDTSVTHYIQARLRNDSLSYESEWSESEEVQIISAPVPIVQPSITMNGLVGTFSLGTWPDSTDTLVAQLTRGGTVVVSDVQEGSEFDFTSSNFEGVTVQLEVTGTRQGASHTATVQRQITYPEPNNEGASLTLAPVYDNDDAPDITAVAGPNVISPYRWLFQLMRKVNGNWTYITHGGGTAESTENLTFPEEMTAGWEIRIAGFVSQLGGKRTQNMFSSPQIVQSTSTLNPPQVVGSLADERYDLNSGNQTVDAGAVFTGQSLTFSINVTWATIDPETGVITIPTDTLRTGATIVVIASNGSLPDATAGFQVTVAEPSDVDSFETDATLIGQGGADNWDSVTLNPAATSGWLLAFVAARGYDSGRGGPRPIGSVEWTKIAEVGSGELGGQLFKIKIPDGATVNSIFIEANQDATMVWNVPWDFEVKGFNPNASSYEPVTLTGKEGDLLLFGWVTDANGDYRSTSYTVNGVAVPAERKFEFVQELYRSVGYQYVKQEGSYLIEQDYWGAGDYFFRFMVAPIRVDETPVEPIPDDWMPDPLAHPQKTMLSTTSLLDNGGGGTGVTLTTQSPVEAAQDENGKWLIRFASATDEIVITGSDLPSANGRHGLMVQPFMGKEARITATGWDSRSYANPYDPTLNLDPGHTGEPLVIRAADYPDGVVLVKVKSRDTVNHSDGDRGDFSQYFEIAIVPHDTPVPDRFYAPQHRQHDCRLIFSYYDLQLDRINTIDLSGSGLDLTPTTRGTFPVAIPGNEGQRGMNAYNTLETYGRELLTDDIYKAFLGLIDSNTTDEQRRDWLRWIIPAGLNCLFAHYDEMEVAGTKAFWANGAHMEGRFELAMIAGLLLPTAFFKERLLTNHLEHRSGSSGWQEKDNTFIVSDGTVNALGFHWPTDDTDRQIRGGGNDSENGDVQPFNDTFLRMPYFGSQHAGDPSMDEPNRATRYSFQNWPQQATPMSCVRMIDGAMEIMGWDPYWATLDTYMDFMAGQQRGDWGVIGGFGTNYFPAAWEVQFWDDARTLMGHTRYDCQPDPALSPSVVQTANNQVTITWHPYKVANNGQIVSYNILAVPQRVSVDGRYYAGWQTREPILWENVQVNANRETVITDNRLGASTEDINWRFVCQYVDDASRVSPVHSQFDTGIALTGPAKPHVWEPAVLGADGPLVPGTNLSLMQGGFYTGGNATKSYRILQSPNGTGSWTEYSSGTSKVVGSGDVGKYLRVEEKLNNGVGGDTIAYGKTQGPIKSTPTSFATRIAVAGRTNNIPVGDQGDDWLLAVIAAHNDPIGDPQNVAYKERLFYSGEVQKKRNYVWLIKMNPGVTTLNFNNPYNRVYASAVYRVPGKMKLIDGSTVGTSSGTSLSRTVRTDLDQLALVWGHGYVPSTGPAGFDAAQLTSGEAYIYEDLTTGQQMRSATVTMSSARQFIMSMASFGLK